MRSALRAADDWLFAAVGPQRLAVFRVMCGAFSVVYVAVRIRRFLDLADAPAARFDPLGPLAPLDSPVSGPLVVSGVVVLLALGVAFTCGLWFRVTGPLFAVALLLATTYRSSWGQVLYFETLMVLHVLIVGFTRSADALSVDARRRGGTAPAPASPASPATPATSATSANPCYGWPIRLAACVTVLTYVLAGVAKLRIGGVEWMDGETLRNHVAYSAARLDVLGGSPSPFAEPLLDAAWLFTPLAVATVVIELAAPVALLGGAVRNVWVVAAWLMHAGIAALMFVVFPYPLALVAFAPLFELERLADGVRSVLGSAIRSDSPTLLGPRPDRN